MNREKNNYEDILYLPHHQSETRPHMSLYDRAAQFSPFAALTGHEAAIRETQRLTERERLLDEDVLKRLNEKFRWIEAHLSEQPEMTFTCFVPDEKKDGGRYKKVSGRVKKIDWYEKKLILADKECLDIEHIADITGDEKKDGYTYS